MLRVANVVMVVALLLTAAVVYQLKYASTAEAERLANLRTAIRKERESIALMKAEWARRTSPIYIQGLVKRHLELKPLDVAAFSNLDDLPQKPAGDGDGIGGMLEALVDAPLVTSSLGKPATATTPASTTATGGIGGGALSTPARSALRNPNAPKPPKPDSHAPRPVTQAAPRAPSAPPGDGLAPMLPPASMPGLY